MPGIARSIFPATQEQVAHVHATRGWQTGVLDARSPHLLNPDFFSQVHDPGMFQPLPSTAALLLAALGNPVGATAANILAIYECDTASPLVDSLGLGPNFIGSGGPLTGRECVGLPNTTFGSKVGIEFGPISATGWDAANVAFGDVTGASPLGFILVLRPKTDYNGSDYRVLGKLDGAHVGWVCGLAAAGDVYTRACNAASPWPVGTVISRLLPTGTDSQWETFALGYDPVMRTCSIVDRIGASVSGPWTGSISNAAALNLGRIVNDFGAQSLQIAYLAVLSFIPTSAMLANFWRAFQLPAQYTYTRASPLVVPISATRVACYGSGQVAPAYHPALVQAAFGNALGTGLSVEGAHTFGGLGTTNPATWLYSGGGSPALVDGPDGCRSAVRAIDAVGGSAEYVETKLWTLAGATAVAHTFGAQCRAVGGGGLNAVCIAHFTGDPGGPENLVVYTWAGTVPADWTQYPIDNTCPTWYGTVTPVGNAHTGVTLRLYPTDGVAASLGTVDFAGDCWGVQSANPVGAWIRVPAGAALPSAASLCTCPNTGNRIYNPARGRAVIRVAGMNANTVELLKVGTGASPAGGLSFRNAGASLTVRIWNSAAGLVATLVGPAVDAAAHQYHLLWDAQNPLDLGPAVGQNIALVENRVVLASFAGTWTPPTTDVTPIIAGNVTTGGAPGNCVIALMELMSAPGTLYD